MAREDPLEGQVIENRYRLRRRVGSGGMSVVYLGERLGIGKPIAIKFLRSAFVNLPDFVGRFEQEARACSRLSHLNCVSVIDFGVAFGSPYLVMEYVRGRLLNELIARGALAPERAVGITHQILAGLRHAHHRGVIHRDLKPGNVMLMEMTGTPDFVKIMDFGTAQITTGEAVDPRLAGTDVGTPWYMTPEQAAGQPTGPHTDLYAVGVILFEMLTGSRPFSADDPMRVLQMHLQSPVPSPRALRPDIWLSAELEAVIVQAMQKCPEERFVSAEAFDEALGAVPEVRPRLPGANPALSVEASAAASEPGDFSMSQLALPQVGATAEVGPLKPVRRWPRVLAILGLLLLLLAAAAAVLVATGVIDGDWRRFLPG